MLTEGYSNLPSFASFLYSVQCHLDLANHALSIIDSTFLFSLGLSRCSLIQNQGFFPWKMVVLAALMFISLVLFQFGCFDLSLETFKQFTPKGYTMCVQQYLV